MRNAEQYKQRRCDKFHSIIHEKCNRSGGTPDRRDEPDHKHDLQHYKRIPHTASCHQKHLSRRKSFGASHCHKREQSDHQCDQDRLSQREAGDHGYDKYTKCYNQCHALFLVSTSEMSCRIVVFNINGNESSGKCCRIDTIQRGFQIIVQIVICQEMLTEFRQ